MSRVAIACLHFARRFAPTINEAKQQDVVSRSHHRNIRMLAGQLGIGPDGGDRAVFLQQPLLQQSRHRQFHSICAGDHRSTADQ
jgi:hypothetical protein